VLAGGAAAVGAAVRWRRTALLGAAAGLLAAGALLSLAWSVQVRVASGDIVAQAARELGARVQDGEVVALCGVPRTVVDPAPRGAFAVHEFIYDWAAADAVAFYSGRHVQFRLAGELWAGPCADPGDVDVVVPFDELLRERR
jgi:cytosine/adenosine deaminase-related metal-dependent hydrolase